jgi:uncharacterized protein (TIGR02757 family)
MSFPQPAKDAKISAFLEAVYGLYHKPELIRPDPLQFLLDFPEAEDKEIVGLFSSSLAFGRIGGILRASSDAISRLGPRPSETLDRLSGEELAKAFSGFSYRIFSDRDLAALAIGIKGARKEFGSLKALFLRGFSPTEDTVAEAANSFVKAIRSLAPPFKAHLLPLAEKKSACKRLFLYLRWMSRKDHIDPGCWEEVPRKSLIVPMDTHMAFAARKFGFIGDPFRICMKSALEVTANFRRFAPEDPVKWDFSLTRLGIRSDIDREGTFGSFGL